MKPGERSAEREQVKAEGRESRQRIRNKDDKDRRAKGAAEVERHRFMNTYIPWHVF